MASPGSVFDPTTFTTVFGSLIAGFLTTALFFSISHTAEIWILIFLMACAYMSMAVAANQYLIEASIEQAGTRPGESQEEARKAAAATAQPRTAFLSFLNMTMVIVLLGLVVEVLWWAIAVTAMTWTDYLILFEFAVFIIFVLFFKLAALLSFQPPPLATPTPMITT